MSTPYGYVLVRTDMSLSDQIVQVGHACMEAARVFTYPDGVHLVVLGFGDGLQLRDALDRLRLHGVAAFAFHEPDRSLGLTAACTEALRDERRRPLRRFRMWTPEP